MKMEKGTRHTIDHHRFRPSATTQTEPLIKHQLISSSEGTILYSLAAMQIIKVSDSGKNFTCGRDRKYVVLNFIKILDKPIVIPIITKMIQIETTEECMAVQKLRDRTKDLNHDEITDVVLLRYFRARESVDKAENQLRKTLKWRDEMKIDAFAYWRATCKYVEDDLIFKFTGCDKEGRPVYWVPIGRWHVRNLIEQGYRTDINHMRYHVLEYIINNTKKLGQHQSVIIFGIEQLTYSQVLHLESMQIMFSTFRDLADHYPETIKTMFIINTPWFFPYVMNMLRPLLSPRTSAKLKIYNSDKTTWLSALRDTMPEKSIPEEYLED